ncbi:MAG: hypothetical protein JWP81_3394 [Ferruginibacter sp.]|nr:hypothetical protein [Ferruginibacter sp.]
MLPLVRGCKQEAANKRPKTLFEMICTLSSEMPLGALILSVTENFFKNQIVEIFSQY